MEVDRVQCKFARISRNGNGVLGSGNGVGEDRKMVEQYQDEEENGEGKEVVAGAIDVRGAVGRFYGWPSSRIVRVSRASGGKDRHSKVLTSKGLRDRRVRLSVNTAIQFYDLQDRLRYDQPSKAVEWLLKAAASSIAELPPIDSPFPDTPRQLSDEKISSTGGDSTEACGGDPCYVQKIPATKSSACSSNSDNSKNSGLSLSRSRKRAAEKNERDEMESSSPADSLNPISQTTSFTELLNGGLHNASALDNHASVIPNSSLHQIPNRCVANSIYFQKSPRPWPSDIFSGGLLGPPSTGPGQMHLVNTLRPMFTVAGEHQSEIQNLSSTSDHFAVANPNSAGGGGGGNNSNNSNHHHGFTISSSSGLPGFNRGTLQSNTPPPSSSLLPTPSSFFTGAAPLDNHFLSGLHLYGQKGKGKK